MRLKESKTLALTHRHGVPVGAAVLFSLLYLIPRGLLRLVPNAEGGREREVEILSFATR